MDIRYPVSRKYLLAGNAQIMVDANGLSGELMGLILCAFMTGQQRQTLELRPDQHVRLGGKYIWMCGPRDKLRPRDGTRN